MNVALALTQWTALLLLRLVLIIVGLPIVAVALPFRRNTTSVSDQRPIVVLPSWAWLWSNDYDGVLGDKRGWWDANAPFGLGANHLFSMWVWTAVRNPVNNLRLIPGVSCPVNECHISHAGQRTVEDKPGQGGWQFVTAARRSSRWYGFYAVYQWSDTRAFVVRIGYKIKPGHMLTVEPPKGMTFKINPWKAI
jgi:hypothetical protein